MVRYFLKLAYKGTAYHGWQIQENASTVQEELNHKIGVMTGDEVNLVGCGRTDTGVHAREFYAHFDLTVPLHFLEEDFVAKLNSFLSKDIVILGLCQVPKDYHARFSATQRTYKYYISRRKNPFERDFCLEYTGPLDLEAMQEAAGYLQKYTDFTSFSKLHTQTKTNDCVIKEAYWEVQGDKLIFTISADRFLRNMVRAVVGTLMEVGKGKMKPREVEDIINAKDRSRAGYSVPAKGLFLEKVEYPFSLEDAMAKQ
ncbi:MAG: tRNA pseudouridine(38-40) synthase TruA [Bacteroidales bacterium]|nr:tRNA pseudouridine(38-40) synthase TruA [Bacteroidales bacterium]